MGAWAHRHPVWATLGVLAVAVVVLSAFTTAPAWQWFRPRPASAPGATYPAGDYRPRWVTLPNGQRTLMYPAAPVGPDGHPLWVS